MQKYIVKKTRDKYESTTFADIYNTQQTNFLITLRLSVSPIYKLVK